MHKSIYVVQLVAGALALAAIVAGEAMGWSLTAGTVALLGGVVGLALKRPSDLVAKK